MSERVTWDRRLSTKAGGYATIRDLNIFDYLCLLGLKVNSGWKEAIWMGKKLEE